MNTIDSEDDDEIRISYADFLSLSEFDTYFDERHKIKMRNEHETRYPKKRKT
ncbi:MAG: hypothetical protein DDT40_01921 [candidate division WS2 bacterium]|nr:hypothetical protein [Candidatus Psychracetigena formicireducens]